MKNRIISGAVLSLALFLIPGLVAAKPTATIKKKKSLVKSSLSRTVRKSKKTTKRSVRRHYPKRIQKAQIYDLPYEGDQNSLRNLSVTPFNPGTASVGETQPLIKVIPQRDGRFLLEPLTPKKPLGHKPATTPDTRRDTTSSGRGYHKWEPWNFPDLILTRAQGYSGAPYRRGSSLEYSSATDCSGFVQYIYQGFKIDLPRSSSEQAQVGRVVTQSMDFSKLLPGDLLFFRRGGRSVGHSGIYLGEGKMIHASNHRNGVTITDLRQPYYQNTFVVAKRVFEVSYPD